MNLGYTEKMSSTSEWIQELFETAKQEQDDGGLADRKLDYALRLVGTSSLADQQAYELELVDNYRGFDSHDWEQIINTLKLIQLRVVEF